MSRFIMALPIACLFLVLFIITSPYLAMQAAYSFLEEVLGPKS